MVSRLPKLCEEHDDICKGCALGKKIKRPFHSSESTSKSILDLVHFDLCGPMLVASLSGILYNLIFIDDYS